MLEEVRLLSAGMCLHPEAVTLKGGSWKPCEFPAGFALIYHSRFGAVLYDTGYSEHFLRSTREFPNRLYAMLTPPKIDQGNQACRQLAALGIAPTDVRTIVLSHFHADHIAGLRDFPRARIVCSERGWQAVRHLRGLRALVKGFIAELVPDDVEKRLHFVESMQTVQVPFELGLFGLGRDILGDGSLIAVDLPGHTASQLGLLIDIEGLSVTPVQGTIGAKSKGSPVRAVLLVADAAWSTRALESGTPPPALTTDFLGDTVTYRRTLHRLSNLRKVNPELLMLPSHCGASYNIVASRCTTSQLPDRAPAENV